MGSSEDSPVRDWTEEERRKANDEMSKDERIRVLELQLSAERERCAKIAEEMTMRGEIEETRGYVRISLIAEKIRIPGVR